MLRPLRRLPGRLGVRHLRHPARRPSPRTCPLIAQHVDYVAPMLYPERWGRTEYDVADPQAQPYDIVFRSLVDFQIAVAPMGRAVVPWLQDYSGRVRLRPGRGPGPDAGRGRSRHRPAGCSGAPTASTASTATPARLSPERGGPGRSTVSAVERSQYLDALADESAAFYAAVSRCPLRRAGAVVPGLDGRRTWCTTSARSTASGVRWWPGDCARRSGVERPHRPPPEDLVTWAREQAGALQAALAEADPATPVWTWAAQQDVALRRPPHGPGDRGPSVGRGAGRRHAGADRPRAGQRRRRRVPHRHAGRSPLHGGPDRRLRPPARHRHAGRVAGHARATTGRSSSRAEHAKGDVALRGPASDLLLLVLWRPRRARRRSRSSATARSPSACWPAPSLG